MSQAEYCQSEVYQDVLKRHSSLQISGHTSNLFVAVSMRRWRRKWSRVWSKWNGKKTNHNL